MSHAGGKDRLHNKLFSYCIERGTSGPERKQCHLKNSLFPQLVEALKGWAGWEMPGQNCKSKISHQMFLDHEVLEDEKRCGFIVTSKFPEVFKVHGTDSYASEQRENSPDQCHSAGTQEMMGFFLFWG